jgi:hypothetical protein
MENQDKINNGSPIFSIALFLLFITFIFLFKSLPFSKDLSFFQMSGMGVVCIVVGVIIFSVAMGLIDFFYKFIIEVALALVLFFNVSYTAFCWSYFNEAMLFLKEWGIDVVHAENKFMAFLILALLLFMIDVVVAFIMVPLSRIVGTKVLA